VRIRQSEDELLGDQARDGRGYGVGPVRGDDGEDPECGTVGYDARELVADGQPR